MKSRFLLTLICFPFIFAASNFGQSNNVKQSNEKPTTAGYETIEASLGELEKELTQELNQNNSTSVAIADFSYEGVQNSPIGQFLAQEMITRLYRNKKLKVVDRNQLEKVIEGRKKSMTDLLTAATSNRQITGLALELINIIGNKLAVKAVVIGSVRNVGGSLRVYARLVYTKDGSLGGTADTWLSKSGDVCSLVVCESDTISSKDSDVAKPVQISPTKKRTSDGLEDFTVSANFFTFSLTKCSASGLSVLCEYTVSNEGPDRKLGIYRSSTKLYDDSGNSYGASNVTLANFRFDYSAVVGDLLSGATAKGVIRFDKLVAKPESILRLVIKAKEGRQQFQVTFENVPL
jgi:TolB-like protein